VGAGVLHRFFAFFFFVYFFTPFLEASATWQQSNEKELFFRFLYWSLMHTARIESLCGILVWCVGKDLVLKHTDATSKSTRKELKEMQDTMRPARSFSSHSSLCFYNYAIPRQPRPPLPLPPSLFVSSFFVVVVACLFVLRRLG
jgi:hypothetical protein